MKQQTLAMAADQNSGFDPFRKPSDAMNGARQVFEAVIFVPRAGCQRKALPKERLGSASAVHKRFLEWEAAGVFDSRWQAGLAECDQMEGIAWQWQTIDAAMFKAPLAQPDGSGGKGEQAPPAGGRPSRRLVARRDRDPYVSDPAGPTRTPSRRNITASHDEVCSNSCFLRETLERSFVTFNHVAAEIRALRKIKLTVNVIYG